MNQKDEEILILNSFIKNYDTSIRVLTKEEAVKIYPNYTGENPDFIIIYNNENIGIELFRLVQTKNDNMYLRKEEESLNIKNLPHLKGIRSKSNTSDFYKQENVFEVALERINEKILYKISNYVTEKVWLLGYASEFYNMSLLSVCKDDNTIEDLKSYLLKNCAKSPLVKKIFLLERMKEVFLIEIKIAV